MLMFSSQNYWLVFGLAASMASGGGGLEPKALKQQARSLRPH
jgi:hypothetical protein